MIRRAILVGVTSVTLASCGQERPAIAKPPVALLSCADEPVAPDLPPRAFQDQRDLMMLDYVLSWRTAWGDCSAKLAGVKAWSEAVE